MLRSVSRLVLTSRLTTSVTPTITTTSRVFPRTTTLTLTLSRSLVSIAAADVLLLFVIGTGTINVSRLDS